MTLKYQTDPISPKIRMSLKEQLRSDERFDINSATIGGMVRVLRESPSNAFGFFHLAIPHGPWIYNVDGSYRKLGEGGSVSREYEQDLKDGYERNLQYLDKLIGQFVDELKVAGKYEDSMIILTSDHSWRKEPDSKFLEDDSEHRWVPLVIKCPGQQDPHVVDNAFTTTQLTPILDVVLQNSPGEDLSREVLRRIHDTVARRQE